MPQYGEPFSQHHPGLTLEVGTSFQFPTLCGPGQGRGFVSLGLRFLICEVGTTSVGCDDKGATECPGSGAAPRVCCCQGSRAW